MKPLVHAKMTVKKYGGKVEDYIAIHNFIDHTKMCMPDVRHRALLHSSFGCYMVEQVYGVSIVNSDGKDVSTRDIAEEHIIQDLGFIPTVEKWLDKLPIEPWMGGAQKRNIMSFDNQPTIPKNDQPVYFD